MLTSFDDPYPSDITYLYHHRGHRCCVFARISTLFFIIDFLHFLLLILVPDWMFNIFQSLEIFWNAVYFMILPSILLEIVGNVLKFHQCFLIPLVCYFINSLLVFSYYFIFCHFPVLYSKLFKGFFHQGLVGINNTHPLSAISHWHPIFSILNCFNL